MMRTIDNGRPSSRRGGSGKGHNLWRAGRRLHDRKAPCAGRAVQRPGRSPKASAERSTQPHVACHDSWRLEAKQRNEAEPGGPDQARYQLAALPFRGGRSISSTKPAAHPIHDGAVAPLVATWSFTRPVGHLRNVRRSCRSASTPLVGRSSRSHSIDVVRHPQISPYYSVI